MTDTPLSLVLCVDLSEIEITKSIVRYVINECASKNISFVNLNTHGISVVDEIHVKNEVDAHTICSEYHSKQPPIYCFKLCILCDVIVDKDDVLMCKIGIVDIKFKECVGKSFLYYVIGKLSSNTTDTTKLDITLLKWNISQYISNIVSKELCLVTHLHFFMKDASGDITKLPYHISLIK